MARYFQVTTAGGMSALKLDTQGRATVQYTVKNVSARPIDGRAILVSLPVLTPPSGAVEKGWVKVGGNTDRHFDVNQEDTFPVTVSVPPKSAPNKYAFRMDMVWVDKPDEGDAGPAVSFEVPKPNGERKPGKLLWLIPVVVLVLAAAGVGIWWWLTHQGPKVPNLVGKTVPEATAALTAAKLTLDPSVETVQSKPEDADKVVDQKPAADEKVKEGDAVHLKVGAQMVTVPMLIGHRYEEAQTMLTNNHLTVGQATNQPNPNFSGGVIFAQDPSQGTSVLSGSAVNVSVTPKTVAVPKVTQISVGQAIQNLQRVGLQVGTLNGDQVDQPVTGQNPEPNVLVAVGSKVDLTVPKSPPCALRGSCFFTGRALQLMTAPVRTMRPINH